MMTHAETIRHFMPEYSDPVRAKIQIETESIQRLLRQPDLDLASLALATEQLAKFVKSTQNTGSANHG